jgi:hypothetical protein
MQEVAVEAEEVDSVSPSRLGSLRTPQTSPRRKVPKTRVSEMTLRFNEQDTAVDESFFMPLSAGAATMRLR